MQADDSTTSEIILRPVGTVRNQIKTPMLAVQKEDIELQERIEKIREHHRWVKTLVSELVIDPDMEELLEGVEDFSHIVVLYWPHLVPPERRDLRRVHPMGRKDLPKRGIFATRSPARPNPVLLSTVRLLERRGNVLRVEGLEAVDGSPLLDIKPFVQTYHEAANPVIPEWMRQIHRDLQEGLEDEHSPEHAK
jgi:tRNA-Thr(GGU) m(6)t(6)A37 methyltransferase TsaA